MNQIQFGWCLWTSSLILFCLIEFDHSISCNLWMINMDFEEHCIWEVLFILSRVFQFKNRVFHSRIESLLIQEISDSQFRQKIIYSHFIRIERSLDSINDRKYRYMELWLHTLITIITLNRIQISVSFWRCHRFERLWMVLFATLELSYGYFDLSSRSQNARNRLRTKYTTRWLTTLIKSLNRDYNRNDNVLFHLFCLLE